MPTQRRMRSRTLAVVSIIGEVIGLLMQVLLVYMGALLLWSESQEFATLQLLGWCLIASLYLGATIITLNFVARMRQPEVTSVRGLTAHPITRVLSTITTFGSSLLGLGVALDLITSLGLEKQDPLQEFSAVWAMLLSWALFNWGYSRIYFSRYHRSTKPPLTFPGTEDPGIIDFVYFAFTNATTFAVSDVKVLDSHMRWTVVWHTTLAFFFNALIIALSMNVISNGKFFATVLG